MTAETLTRTVRPFGATFRVDADDQRVLDALDHALARYPTDAGASGRYTLRARTGADTAADPAWPVTKTTFADGRLTLRCGSGTLFADANAGTADLILPPALLAIPDAVRMCVEGAASTLLINNGQLRAVHAGLVGFGGTHLLLRGPSGAGKSTLTYSCLRAGADIVSDDWTYSVPGRPAGQLWGYPWRMFLVQEAIGRFPELAGAASVLHPGADRLKIPVEPPVERQRTGALVDAVVFLDPSPELELRPVGTDEAHERFWGPALPTERSDLPASFVAELLDRPCYVLQRGTDPMAAVALLQRLASS